MRVLKRGRYEMWKDGKIHLRNCAQRVSNPVWGDSVRVTPVAELARFTQRTARGRYEGNRPIRPLRPPDGRHRATDASVRGKATSKNTVTLPSVDVSADVQAINQGRAARSDNMFEVNGRVYGVKEPTGQLYPVSGAGVFNLSRGAYKALRILNSMGYNETTVTQVSLGGIQDGEWRVGLAVWRLAQG